MSTETKHTKGPWQARNGSASIYAGYTLIADCLAGFHGTELAKANARRIVACVNACAGISDEQLEDDKLDVFLQALRISTLEAQNKELREAGIAWLDADSEDALFDAMELMEISLGRKDKALSGGG